VTRPPSRREFLGASGAAAMLAFGSWPDRLLRGRGGGSLRIRRSATDLAPDDPVFQKYAAAVKKMHELPATDRRSWSKQGQIHADHCAHGGFDFLPWHRHYITQFEKICGQLIGDPTFALPYWDWTRNGGVIPNPFFSINELNVAFWNDSGVYSSDNWGDIDTIGIRAIGPGVGVQSDPIRGGAFLSQNIDLILGESLFDRFTWRLEGSPHNSGHVVVGFPPTGKTGHMGSGLSSLDPLFWLHHCNVDRIWAQWQLAGNTTPQFTSTYDGDFVDESGAPVNVTALAAIDFTSLGFSYDQFADPSEFLSTAGIAITDTRPVNSRLAADRVADPGIKLVSVTQVAPVQVGAAAEIAVQVPDLAAQLAQTRVSLETSLPTAAALRARGGRPDSRMLSRFGKKKRTARRVLAIFRGVTAQFARPPIVNVFVNCPYVGADTPYTDPHYAGTFSFFGRAHGEGQDFVVDLSEAVRKVDLGGDKLNVQLVPLSPAGREPEGRITVKSIDIVSA
jgi:tyrosinase